MPRTKRARPAIPNLRIGGAVFVDVVSFSRRPTADQVAVLKDLNAAIRACPSFKRATDAGEVILAPAGDGFGLVFTTNPLTALQCAEELGERVADLGFALRMGVHVGAYQPAEDIQGMPNAAGELLNTAARAMGCAHAGHLLLTRQAADIARESQEFGPRLRHAGHATVKHGLELDLFQLVHRDEPLFREKALKRWHPLAVKFRARAAKSRPASDLADTGEIAERLAILYRDAKVGCVIVAFALVLHVWGESSTLGHKLQLWVYEQLEASIPAPAGQLPVTVVDFGQGLQQSDASGSTNMTGLAALIGEIAKSHPAAIGVDVDFGPLLDQTYAKDEGAVVNLADKLTSEGTPVYLTVNRGIWLTPDAWLGGSEFARLAVHPLAPLEPLSGQITLFDQISASQDTATHLVPGMSGALATALLKEKPHKPLSNLIAKPYAEADTVYHSVSPQLPSRLGQRYYINFSALPTLEKDTIRAATPEALDAISNVEARLNRAAVLIGSTARDANGSVPDQWTVPSTGEVKAGIYLLALGAYTKAESPLYELTPWVREGLIILASCAVVLSVIGVRLGYIARREAVAESRLSLFFTVILALVTLVAGILLVRTFGILWTDFFLVAVFLTLHPRIEHSLIHGCSWLCRSIEKTWGRIVFAERR